MYVFQGCFLIFLFLTKLVNGSENENGKESGYRGIRFPFHFYAHQCTFLQNNAEKCKRDLQNYRQKSLQYQRFPEIPALNAVISEFFYKICILLSVYIVIFYPTLSKKLHKLHLTRQSLAPQDFISCSFPIETAVKVHFFHSALDKTGGPVRSEERKISQFSFPSNIAEIGDIEKLPFYRKMIAKKVLLEKKSPEDAASELGLSSRSIYRNLEDIYPDLEKTLTTF